MNERTQYNDRKLLIIRKKKSGFIDQLKGKNKPNQPKIIMTYMSVIKHNEFNLALDENRKEKHATYSTVQQ